MSITLEVGKVTVDGVHSITVTDIVQDPVTSLYTREVRVFGLPNGTDLTPLLFTLRLTAAATEVEVELTAPPAQF